MLRLNALFCKLRREDEPILGRHVVDFWWRVEFQLRGSPHVHMVIWCADMPAFESVEGTQLLERVVTCCVPGTENDPEMHDLVTQLQTHRHTRTCYKNNRNVCRFGFPRQVSEKTDILDDDQAMKNGGRFYVLKRTESETMINCYNYQLLKLWRANIDIQPCSSALGVAYYISKYISKAEPVEVSRSIRQAIQNVRARGDSNNSGRLIFAIQNAILTHREISANECAFRLCHLKLRDSSRKCVFINTCVPEQRYRMIRLDTDNCEPYKNIFDRYVHRPHSLDYLSLGEFAIWYDVVSTRVNNEEDQQDLDAYDTYIEDQPRRECINLLDNMGRMRKRTRQAILRTRYFTLASDPEAYYYSLILTHIPFRAEEELLEGFESAKSAFWSKRNQLRPLQEGFDNETLMQVEIEIQQAISRIIAENLTTAVLERQLDDIRDNTYHPIDRVINDDDQFIIDEVDEPNNVGMTDIQFETAVSSLNLSQRQLFKKVSQKLLDASSTSQLLIFVTGGAGTGKTFTLKVLTEQIRRLSSTDISKSVAVTAPTGVAARLIGGNTLHSTFALPIEKGRPQSLRALTGERLQRERFKWNSINWLIIDEIPMVPYVTLRNIHLRLQQLKQNEGFFGGINVILFGDLMQLPPVSKITGGAYCFRQPSSFSGEIHLWHLFSFCELPQNMRQAGDNIFVNILNSLRVGEVTMEQLEILDSRRIPLVGLFADGEAVRIFPTVKQVDAYNLKMTSELGKSVKLYTLNAVDISLECKTYGQRPRKEFVPDDPNKTGGILSTLSIGSGSRVMLRRNININRGLVNGAMGVVRNIEWPALRRYQLEKGELPQAVFIEFDDPTIHENHRGVGVRIEPCTVDFDALRGQGKIERRMLPLILCWAVTVHKLQGTTLERAVVDLSSQIFTKSQAYVALSRVKTLDGLAISHLDPKKLLQRPHDQNSLEELKRLRELP